MSCQGCIEGLMAWLLHGDGAECLGCHRSVSAASTDSEGQG
jgi:hypothetical protein